MTELHKVWGYHALITLYDCDLYKIRSKECITNWIFRLCKLINMKMFGEPVVVHFGSDECVQGYSAFQLIETSSITAHFVEASNTVFIDIFSCKPYDVHQTYEFCKQWFDCDDGHFEYVYRR